MNRTLLIATIGVACLAVACLVLFGAPVFSASDAVSMADIHWTFAEGGAAVTAADILKKFETNHSEVTDALKRAGMKHDEIAARLTELEQKAARRGSAGAEVPETWGHQVARQLGGQGQARINSNFKGRARFEVKTTATLTSASGGAAGDAGALVAPDRQSSVIELPRRKLKMRDVFAPGQTTSNLIEWPRHNARSNNAATVAEGALKPQSDMTFEMASWPVRTIAHWVLASRQMLDDAPQLQSLIDSDLRYGLDDVEDGQLLNGGGTGTDLTGVYTNATAFSPPIQFTAAGNLTKIDVLLLAIAQLQALKHEPDFIAINPLDWADIQAIKTDDGAYLGQGPFSAQAAVLWRLPVVETTSMTLDRFLVGSGKRGAQIFDRQESTVEISTEDSDNFRKNLVTVLAEKRLAFVIKRNDAFVKGTFTDALAAS